MSPGPLLAALSTLGPCVLAPDAIAFGQVGELASDLLAVRLVLSADLPDQVPGMLTDSRAPCAGLISGRGYRQGLSPENLLRILLKERVDGAAGTADLGVPMYR